MYLSVGEAAKVVGVSVSTLRRWEQEEKFEPCYRTPGGHRRYSLNRIKREIYGEVEFGEDRYAVIYARVSSHDQRMDLVRQEERLVRYCESNDLTHELISDLGSGINYRKKGLNKLIRKICNKEVSKLILTHRDRLLRFGSQLLFQLCEVFDTEVIILENTDDKTFEQELVADVIEIMTVFTAKMYGKRAHKNKQVLHGDRAC